MRKILLIPLLFITLIAFGQSTPSVFWQRWMPTADTLSTVNGKIWLDPVTNKFRYISGGVRRTLGITSGTITGTGTTNELPYWTSSTALGSLTTTTYPSLTELSYVKGVTSSIQTQINSKGSGTVTSVGFTGGLISVATATTTPALTVAGASGGIPYFSSSSTWASSGVLGSNAIVLGGGAGTTPFTNSNLTYNGTTISQLNSGAGGGISVGLAGFAPNQAAGISVRGQNVLIEAEESGGASRFRVTNTGIVTMVQTASGSSTGTYVSIAPGAHTASLGEWIDFSIANTRTVQFSVGTPISLQRSVSIGTPTYSYNGTNTITSAINESFGGAPIAGANATITTSYGLKVTSGSVTTGGGSVGTAYTAHFTAPSGASTNYVLRTDGGQILFANSSSDVITSNTRVGIRGLGTTTGNILRLSNASNTTVFTATDNGNFNLVQGAQTANWNSVFKVEAGAHTGLTASTEFVSSDFVGATQTWADGSVTTQRFNYFRGFTLNKTSTSAVFGNAYNVYIDDLTFGSGVTGNKWALGVYGNTIVNAGGVGGMYISLVPTVFSIGGPSGETYFDGVSLQSSLDFNIGTQPSAGSVNIQTTSTGKIGFFNTTAVVKQSVNTILINNVTSGGTLSTIANFTDLVTYANDAATIRNNQFRMAEKLLKIETAMRNYGMMKD